jgi:hypothetical protein
VQQESAEPAEGVRVELAGALASLRTKDPPADECRTTLGCVSGVR